MSEAARSSVRGMAAAALFVLAIIPSPASAADCTLCAEMPALLIADKDGNASGTIRLRNRGTEPVTLQLTVPDFFAVRPDGGTDALNAITTLTPVDSAEKPIFEGTTPLQPGRSIALKITTTSLWQAGMSTATLLNGGEPVVVLKAVRYNVPFNVKVEGPTPEQAVVSLSRSRESYLALRNEDPMAYRFRSLIEIDGRTIEDIHVVPPYRTVRIPVRLPPETFSFLATGTLRSDVRPGVLRLEYDPDPGLRNYPLPVKRYPLTARLSYWPDTWQTTWNSLSLLLVLLLGIAASLLINFALPLQRKRVEVKQLLRTLDGRLAGLDEVIDPIDSRLLSQMRVEKKRLREELSALHPIFPQSAVDLPRLEERIKGFSERIDWVSTVGDILQRQARLTESFSRMEAEELTTHCREILEIAAKAARSPDDLQTVGKRLQAAADSLNSPDVPLPETLPQCLQGQAEKLRGEIPTFLAGPFGEPFKELLDSLVSQFPPQSVPGAYAPTRKDFIRHERAVVKASLIIEFLRLVDQSGSAEVRDQRLAQHRDLLKALQPGPDESLQNASDIVKQVEQNVYVQDVVAGLKDAVIDVDPPTPLPFQLTEFSVRFTQPGVDRAAARDEIVYDWRVNDEELPWHGSSVTYYFTDKWQVRTFIRALQRRNGKQPARFIVEVTCKKPGETSTLQQLVKDDVVLEASKWPVAKTWLSLATLAITVLIVGFGLAGGAEEKLQSLELLPGAIAVFVLGFGADTLKTLITRIGD